MSTKREKKPAAASVSPGTSGPSTSRSLAEQVLAGQGELGLEHYVQALNDARTSTATQAARIIDEIVAREPQRCAPLAGELARVIGGDRKRVVQTAARALPAIAKVAPARVAKHLPVLIEAFDKALPEGREGLVQTFVALCAASIAYQKRLEGVLVHALQSAPPKQLVQWSTLVLPTLKGEPHAHARAVVEARLDSLPRAQAQKIAEALRIRLRPAPLK